MVPTSVKQSGLSNSTRTGVLLALASSRIFSALAKAMEHTFSAPLPALGTPLSSSSKAPAPRPMTRQASIISASSATEAWMSRYDSLRSERIRACASAGARMGISVHLLTLSSSHDSIMRGRAEGTSGPERGGGVLSPQLATSSAAPRKERGIARNFDEGAVIGEPPGRRTMPEAGPRRTL
jgi:hypothetical protein